MSKIELFAKMVCGVKLLTVFAKGFAPDALQSSERASAVLI